MLLLIYLIFSLVFGVMLFWMASFVYTSFRGSPYVPIKPERLESITKYIKPGDRVADLGCGDGRVLLQALKQGAARAEGWEMDALVYGLALKNFNQAKHQGLDITKAKLHFGDFWSAQLSGFNVVYVYQMTKYMQPMKEKIISQLTPGALVISPDYQIPGMKPWKMENGLFIYRI